MMLVTSRWPAPDAIREKVLVTTQRAQVIPEPVKLSRNLSNEEWRDGSRFQMIDRPIMNLIGKPPIDLFSEGSC
jgi:hypothetical protein